MPWDLVFLCSDKEPPHECGGHVIRQAECRQRTGADKAPVRTVLLKEPWSWLGATSSVPGADANADLRVLQEGVSGCQGWLGSAAGENVGGMGMEEQAEKTWPEPSVPRERDRLPCSQLGAQPGFLAAPAAGSTRRQYLLNAPVSQAWGQVLSVSPHFTLTQTLQRGAVLSSVLNRKI